MEKSNESVQGQYLTFTLDKEIFALDISRTREVLEVTAISEIPRTPDFMRGVTNLRGHAVAVVDMRLKLGMSQTEETVDTCIIIMEIWCDNEMLVLGALVDSVREVVEISADNIEPAPKMGTAVKADYIQGMGYQNEQFIILVDMDAVFSDKDLKTALDSKQEVEEIAA